MGDMVDPKDLVEHGYVLDLNRRWAHPLGLEVVLTRTIGGLRFAGFRDLRALPGGAFYGDAMPADALVKAVIIAAERGKRQAARRSQLGGRVERIEGEPPLLTYAAGLADPERDWGAVLDACGRYAVRLVEDLGLPREAATDAAELAVGDIVSALLGVASIDELGRVGFAPPPKPAVEYSAARAESLLNEIEDLQEEHGQLYAAQVEELRTIRAALSNSSDGGAKYCGRLEDLYGLAQPAMRFFQGDPEAVDRFNAQRSKLTAFVRSTLDARPEMVRLLDNAISPAEVKAPAAVLAEIEAEMAPLAEHVAAEREDIARRARELAVAEEKLGRMKRAVEGLRQVGGAV